ncbi:MAG: hypothetical protein JWO38_4867 [Gemmataceae bacterium]|nr:hypothetical protein [Gemmataceae bacterium]
MPDPAYLQVLVQGGSFTVLVVIIVWFGWKVIPDAFQLHQATITDLVTRFTAERKELDDRHERDLTRRDSAFEKLAGGLTQVTTQLETLNHRLDDALLNHSPR